MKTTRYLIVGLGILIALVSLLFINSQRVAAGVTATQKRTLLFPVGGGTWYICQGFNTDEPLMTHRSNTELRYSFDLTPNSKSVRQGGYGCNPLSGPPYASDPAYNKVRAPADGTIRYVKDWPEQIYFSLDSGGCFIMAHFIHNTIVTGHVKQGKYIGTLAPADKPSLVTGNHGVPHLHISALASCNKGKQYTWPPVGFSNASNFQFYGASDFVASGSPLKYYGKTITQDFPAQPMNLNAYCHDYKGYTNAKLTGNTPNDWKCIDQKGIKINLNIDMKDVCKYQMYGLLKVPVFTNNDPNLGKCYIK
jgi:hypothetical protein